jgi:hypothetical protein
MALFLARLSPGGLLLFHISNRHLDVSPVLADLAADAGIEAFMQKDRGEKGPYHFASDWVVMARSLQDLRPLIQASSAGRWRKLASQPGRRVWTDDYGNLLGVMRIWRKWRGFQSVD